MYMKNGLNKFLVPLPGTEKFLGGSTKILAYTNHIIQFGLNKFFAPLVGEIELMNLRINILTEKGFTKLDIFLFDIINFRKSHK